FDWDVDLTSGYAHSFLANVSRRPGTDRFSGCDTPEIGERLREGRFQALLVMGWHLKAYLQGVLAAKRLGIPVMVRGDSHLATPRSRVKKAAKALIYPPLLRLFDAALYVGRRSRAYYERYRYPRDRLFFSPHSVDNAWFAARATAVERERLRSAHGIAHDAMVCLFAGRLVPFKRPGDLIAAAAQCETRAEVMIAGSGELEPEIEDAAAACGVRLHLLGFRNQSEMPAAYAAADCLVLPSAHETWGLVANEALACGRPVVVSDACGCAPDLAKDGSVGRTFPAGNTAALAAALSDLAARPPSTPAIAAVSAAYSLDAAVAGIGSALERIVASA
ncbi:MAG TPA: glycosyltransferase family 4 protein, partial [Hyphomicrobiaceae bacterium]|nr:glycosyltransferase family 4 protein [Hyphomicrobiaceae bacterium]